MKKNLIDTILSISNQPTAENFQAGKNIIAQLSGPISPGINLHPQTHQQLLHSLGQILRTYDFENHPANSQPPKANITESKQSNPNTQPPQHTEETDLSTAARINLDIRRMVSQVRYHSRQLQAATSDRERVQIYKEADKINEAIWRSQDLLRQLEKGNKVKYTNAYFQADTESDFDIPDSILELDKKYRSFMQRRSKRLTKTEQAAAKHGQDSPKHQQALAEWKHCDEVVQHLKAKLDEFKG